MEAASELWTEQRILVGFNGVPPLTKEAISEKSRIDRVQRNLKLGGNTDKKVRPKLISKDINLGLFVLEKKQKTKEDYHDSK